MPADDTGHARLESNGGMHGELVSYGDPDADGWWTIPGAALMLALETGDPDTAITTIGRYVKRPEDVREGSFAVVCRGEGVIELPARPPVVFVLQADMFRDLSDRVREDGADAELVMMEVYANATKVQEV